MRRRTNDTQAGPPQKRRTWVGALLAIGALGATAIGLAIIAQYGTGQSPIGRTVLASSAMEAGPSRAEVHRVLGLSGLTPEILAAAGGSAADGAAVVDAAILFANDNRESINTALSNLSSARAAVDRLAVDVRAGEADDQVALDLAAARADLADAEAALAALKSDIAAALSGSFSADEARVSSDIQGREFDGVPEPYGVHAFSEAELKDLRDALAEERYVAEHGGALDEEQLLTLTTARAKPGVLAALTRVELNLASVQSAWNERLDTTGP